MARLHTSIRALRFWVFLLGLCLTPVTMAEEDPFDALDKLLDDNFDTIDRSLEE